MIHFTPPKAIHLVGPLQINSHGVFFLIGALVAFFWARARTRPKYREFVEGVLPWMTVGGVLGARLLWVLMNPGVVTSLPEFFQVWSGGLISYGGMVGAVLAWLAYLKFYHLPMGELTNAMAPPCLLGWGIGRLGCLLNWDHEWGTPTSVAWAFIGPDLVPRHPVMGYEALALMLAAPLAAALGRRLGSAMGFSLLLYGVARFLADGYREYEPTSLQVTSQATAFGIAVFGMVLLLFRKSGSGDST